MQSLKDIHTYKVIEAWHLFVKEGVIIEDVLRPEIEESWKRCKALDLNPWDALPNPITNEEINEQAKPHEDLLRCAMPIMQYLYATNSTFYLDNIVLLISAQGLTIAQITKSHTGYGPLWKYLNEEKMGTCPGAIVLKEKKPFVVGGYENYMLYNHAAFGGGAPIFGPNGDFIGVIGLYNPYGKIPEQPLEIIISAARIIEDLLEKTGAVCNTSVETGSLFRTLINQVNYNTLLINNDGYIVNANDQSSEFLHLSGSELIGMNCKELNIDLKHFLNKETDPGLDNFVIELNDDSIPCTLNNCEKITGYNGLEYSLLLFSEDLMRRRVREKAVHIPVSTDDLQFKDIIGKSFNYMDALLRARRASQVTATVLIEGESGTGKDVFAHAIHNASPRTGPFVAINCGAIQPNLLQSELFGYEEGSFTGAVKGGKAGKFEMAEGGTLFLDEIGEMPLDMQVNLLRVLQDKYVTRVGGRKAIKFDVRVIAATNIDIKKAVEEGTFRNDLYYRLNVINIKLPPLRERKEDIPLLTDYLVKNISHKMGMGKVKIPEETLSILQQYRWPGNVRELSNVLENALIFTTNNIITPDLLPALITEEADGTHNKAATPDDTEKELIIAALRLYNGNITRAAKDLGISRNTLYKRIYKYRIDNIRR